MIELNTYFILSQIFMFCAMITDFLSFQYKKREHTLLLFAASAALISLHYFFLNKVAAGVIVFFSVIRFITCYFTTEKRIMYFFLLLNTSSLFFTYRELIDLIAYSASCIIVVGNFQKDNRLMRKIMMFGTSTFVLYNIIILSPMGIAVEGLFLCSNFLGYYRHFIRKKPDQRVLVQP